MQDSVETTFLRVLLSDKQNASQAVTKKVKQHYFIEEKDAPFNINRSLFTVIIKYFLQYHDLPIEETIAITLTHSPYSSEQQKQVLTRFAELKLLPAPLTTFEFAFDELRKVYSHNLLKQAIRESLDSLEHNDTEKVVDTLKKSIFKVDIEAQDIICEGTIAASAVERQRHYELLKTNPEAFIGLSTGLPTYDQCTGGLKGGEIHIIASKSSEGKSTLLLNIGYNIQVKLDKSVLYVSIEMPKAQVERRYDAIDADVSYEKLKFGKLSPEEEQRYLEAQKRQRTRKGVFYTYDIQGVCTPSLLATKIKELAAQFTFDVVIIDYLNLISADTATHSLWEEQGKITDEIRKIARTLNIPILTAVQVNREGMKQKADKYEQQHIALSQFIVNHADAILSIKVEDPEALEVSGVAELNCYFMKNRDGARKSFKLIADFERYKMQEPTLTVAIQGQ